MNKCILVRYGEIFLKGNNISFFENRLVCNIQSVLSKYQHKIMRLQNRYYIVDYIDEEEDDIVDALLHVFGIHSLSKSYIVSGDVDSIKDAVLSLVPNNGTFRITVNRGWKQYPIHSVDLAKELGGVVLESNSKLTVDLHNPDNTINVDIREHDKVFVFRDIIQGVGGMPTGTAGNGMVMLSGGIDSPVAFYKMAKRGMKIFAVHFHSFPYTSEMAKEKVVDLAKILSKYNGTTKLTVVPFTEIQRSIHENCPAEFMITIMRRFMMRIAERIAKANNCGAIITGESLGQVASQTLESITVTNSVVKMPVFRPLIGDDKYEIIDISEKIGTYKTSIQPYEDCCTVFLPKFPVIRPKLEIVEKAESKLDIETLINNAINNIEVINIY